MSEPQPIYTTGSIAAVPPTANAVMLECLRQQRRALLAQVDAIQRAIAELEKQLPSR